MQKESLIILISGTPGTGKTVIANVLKDLVSAEYINLTEIVLKNKFIIETDKKRKTEVVDFKKLIPFLKKIIDSAPNKNIIIDGHFADIVPDSITSIVIILRTDPRVLEKRLIEKQFPPPKIQENLQSEILGSCTQFAMKNHDRNKIYEIDTSTLPIEAIIKKIQTLIKDRPPSNVGEINWLQTLEEGNELIKYFQ
ncbi:MAG TPA: adenylate kinase family protein [Candidatus Deferrimicrobium sp.]|nr:adenylate kinase family protein [Candidatus Deferrimicrobium sp.]